MARTVGLIIKEDKKEKELIEDKKEIIEEGKEKEKTETPDFNKKFK